MSFLDRLVRAPSTDPTADPRTGGDATTSGPPPGTAAGETDTVRRIVARLDSLPADRARYLAGFAYILARAAHADLDISDAETQVMERALHELGGLDESQAVLVAQMAKLQSRAKFGTEDYLVTREFAGFATDEQKLDVLRACFAVGAADDEITNDEAQTINGIARELGVDRPSLNAVREAYVDQFSAIRAARRLAKG
jgi:uncharacterized tellurite resistance protein B-like protein